LILWCFYQVRSIDSALLSAEDQDLADTEDTDSSVRGARRRYRGPGVVNGGHVMTTGNKLDDRRMTSARRATAVSAARRISSIANLQQVCTPVIRSCSSRTRGVTTGVYGYLYPLPKKSAQVNFLWGKNDVRTAIQQFYTTPPQKKKLLYPQKQISGYAPESYWYTGCESVINKVD